MTDKQRLAVMLAVSSFVAEHSILTDEQMAMIESFVMNTVAKLEDKSSTSNISEELGLSVIDYLFTEISYFKDKYAIEGGA